MKAKLEAVVADNLPEGERFDVVAFELWGNKREGLEVNSAWFIARDADKAEVLRAARGRWEVFKVNYHSRARVGDVTVDGDERTSFFEVDCIPWLEIRSAE